MEESINMNNILVFDTESNGKAKNFKAPMTDLDNWPRITQLAWQVYTREGVLIKEHETLIYPDGWTIPVEDFFIENNMSTERCLAKGVPLDVVLEHKFIEDFNTCSVIVAHNMAFDKNVLGAEMMRYKKHMVKKEYSWLCTMLSSTDYCKLPGRYGSYKWPSLMELYVKLFGKEFIGAHDALDDVKACAEALFELIRIGIITLPKIT